MKQVMMVTLELDKGIRIPAVVNWMSEKFSGSKVTDVSIQNTDLIFCGALNTYLGDMTINSMEEINIDELNHLLSPHPHFIHQLKFKIPPS